jgi:predicted nucleic acid-binding protein
MSDRIFLDTNVFVYALSKSVPSKQVIASRLLKDAIESGRGTISFQVVQEFFNVAFRRFTPPMTTVDAEQFLTVTLRPLLAVQSSYGLYMQALQLTRGHSLSWYDSLLVAAALESDCRTLYTEDLQHGQTFDSLRIVNPFL